MSASALKGTELLQTGWRAAISRMAILLSLLVVVAVLGVAQLIRQARSPTPLLATGAGAVPALAAWDFDSEDCLLSWDQVEAGGPPKDGIPALTDPEMLAAGEADYLDGEDIVIGVAHGDEARAYPLRILNWHELVNDTVGGMHVLVTYCPLCDSSLVFNRTVGGEVRDFGVSGLLYNSNVLMYDRAEREEDESLWSQMQMRAVCGTAANEGLELELVSSSVTTWRDWVDSHPKTEVLSLNTGYTRDYQRNPYTGYFASDQLMFPVEWEQAADADFPPKERVLIVRHGGAVKGYPYSVLQAVQQEEGEVTDEIAGTRVSISSGDPRYGGWSVYTEEGEPVPSAVAFWFSFRADQPEADVYLPGLGEET